MDRAARAPDAVWRRTSRRIVILTRDSSLVELPGAAALVWDLLDEERPVAQVAAEVADALGSATDDVLQQIRQVMHQVGPTVLEPR